jgi:L-rhamnose mutarotase
VNRYCFTLRVRPDLLDEYRRRHAAVWPDMLLALRDSGWTNYSLFLTEDGLLIGYVEAEDLAEAQAAMHRTEVNNRWQQSMAPFFEGIGGGHADDNFRLVPEVFHLEDQLARAAGAPQTEH